MQVKKAIKFMFGLLGRIVESGIFYTLDYGTDETIPLPPSNRDYVELKKISQKKGLENG